MDTHTGKLSEIINALVFVVAFTGNLLVPFFTQVSSPDYKEIWFGVLPLFLVSSVASVFVLSKKEKKKSIALALPLLLGVLFFTEMTLRVWA